METWAALPSAERFAPPKERILKIRHAAPVESTGRSPVRTSNGTEQMGTRDTRDHLLQVGLRRIRAWPRFHRLERVLDEADLLKGSYYYHFPSKGDFSREALALYVRGECERAEKTLRYGTYRCVWADGPRKRLLGNLGVEIAHHSVQSKLSHINLRGR
jgi:hypothetical protein